MIRNGIFDLSFEILILAAGGSSRFGSPKQLALFKNKPLLVHAVDAALELGVNPLVAIGANKTVIMEEFQARGIKETCRWIDVPRWRKGMSESLRRGVTSLVTETRPVQGVLILLADQPLITGEDLRRIVQKIEAGKKQIICSEYGESFGVPAYFSRHYFMELISTSNDIGAKELISRHDFQAVESGDLRDIDYLEDLLSISLESQ